MATIKLNPKLPAQASGAPEVERGLRAVGFFMTGEIQRQLSGARSGRVYEIRNGRLYPWLPSDRIRRGARIPPIRGPRHVASKPGESPARLFGKLAQSIAFRIDTEGDARVLLLGSNLPYARRLEVGHGSIKPRPYLRPVFRRQFPKARKIFAQFSGYRPGS